MSLFPLDLAVTVFDGRHEDTDTFPPQGPGTDVHAGPMHIRDLKWV